MKKVVIPDIGGAEGVDVIEVMVKAGDKIERDQSLVTLESDKASMEIPSPATGVVKEVSVNIGDKVAEGAVILTLEEEVATAAKEESQARSEPVVADELVVEVEEEASSFTTSEQIIPVPDIGGATDVDVIAVDVKIGDEIEKDQTLITLESDKASMEIPAPFSGKVTAVHVNVGDTASQGDKIATVITTETTSPKKEQTKPAQTATPTTATPANLSKTIAEPVGKVSGNYYAGPSVRRLARELGVDLAKVPGTGRKDRITKDDVKRFVKESINKPAGGGLGVAPMPEIDFSKFGEIEEKPLNKIKKLTAKNLHRNWVTIPHVTQFAEADIVDLEKFRQENKARAEAQGFKFTPLVFIMKAVAMALADFPQFNASISNDGERLIMKKYFHIGVAVDTPNGLVVPVVRDVNQKGLLQLAKELGDISLKARDKGLSVAEMQGGCFTISSLGGIGGTAFTPIVNAPDVAILGVSKSEVKPVYDPKKEKFKPRLRLPLSLSYDHRVIDGAEAARFVVKIAEYLGDIRLFTL